MNTVVLKHKSHGQFLLLEAELSNYIYETSDSFWNLRDDCYTICNRRDWNLSGVEDKTRERVFMGPGKPVESLQFYFGSIRLLVLQSSGNLLNSSKKFEVYGKD